MHGKLSIVRIGKEQERGTAATTALTSPFVGAGWKFPRQQYLAKIKSSGTFPSPTASVALGLTARVTGAPEVNVATIRDIILMAMMRTAGVLPSFTFEQNLVGQEKISGCVCSSLELTFQRSATPDEGAILSATMEFAAMKVAAATGIVAGQYAVGRYFPMALSIFTLDDVIAAAVQSWTWKHTNLLPAGYHKSDLSIDHIGDGDEIDEFTVLARGATAAWRALVSAGTEVATSMVFATGTANETVTLAMGKTRLGDHDPQGDDTVLEQITFSPVHTGVARPVAVSFGSAIGASVLGLS